MIQANTEWQSIEAAARRLDKSPGHLSRLCRDRLKAQGNARWVTGGGKKGRWEISRKFNLKCRRSGGDFPPAKVDESMPGMPIQIKIGAVTITIEVGSVPAVPTIGVSPREAFERPSNGVQPTFE